MFADAPSLVLISFPALLGVAAISDFRRFIIPNWVSLALIGGYLLCHAASGLGWSALGEHALVGLGAFVLGFALFAVGLWGGGDGKLFAATALWFNWSAATSFTIYTLLAGGALAILGLMLYQARFQIWAFKPFAKLDLERLRTHAPYGVAIAIGAMLAFGDSDLYRALDGF